VFSSTRTNWYRGFTSRYNLTRLVYYELFYFAGAAIDREKQIKGWSRSKKIALITSFNPKWDDLAAGWGDRFKPDAQPFGTAREIPRG
jgi:predicted GIY-YIG superfamily endonuclease